MSDIAIRSATASNYQGMIAMVGEDNRVYLGKPENCYLSPDGEAPAYYDNSDRSLRLISDNIRIFHFLYSQDLPLVPAADAPGALFHQGGLYRVCQPAEGVLSHYPLIREVTFAGKPFVPPKAYQRMHRPRRTAPVR